MKENTQVYLTEEINHLVKKIRSEAMSPEKRINYLEKYFLNFDVNKAHQLVFLVVDFVNYPPKVWAVGDYKEEEIGGAWEILNKSINADSLEEEVHIIYREFSRLSNPKDRAKVLNAKLDLLVAGEDLYSEYEKFFN